MFDKSKNKLTGNAGEDIAARYLEQKGYKILDRNVKFPYGEIDILASWQKKIIIVEVKAIRGGGFGLAKDLVRFAKQNKLRLLARSVMQKYSDSPIRIDVVGVDMSASEPVIEHIENAVEG